MSLDRRPIVAILGSGREHGNARLAHALGALVARRGRLPVEECLAEVERFLEAGAEGLG